MWHRHSQVPSLKPHMSQASPGSLLPWPHLRPATAPSGLYLPTLLISSSRAYSWDTCCVLSPMASPQGSDHCPDRCPRQSLPSTHFCKKQGCQGHELMVSHGTSNHLWPLSKPSRGRPGTQHLCTGLARLSWPVLEGGPVA